jgi:hypothetical protein
VSEIGSIIACAAGDDELSSILGTVGTVFGVASGISGAIGSITEG